MPVKVAATGQGWSALEALGRQGGLSSVLLGLRQPGAILELSGHEVKLLTVQPAPDGEFDLQLSGRLVVRGGHVVDVLGRPNAAAGINPDG